MNHASYDDRLCSYVLSLADYLNMVALLHDVGNVLYAEKGVGITD